MGSYITQARYFPDGQLKDYTSQNGLTTSYTQNTLQLPESVAVSHPDDVTDIFHLTYNYDQAGNLVSITNGPHPQDSMHFQYNSVNWLTNANGPWGSGSFEYTVNGDLTQKDMAGQDTSISYDSHDRASSVNGQAIDYDAYGDITRLGNSQFSFNDAKELTQATGTNPEGQAYQINYTYDGNGNRIESDEITPTVQNIIEVRANNHLLFKKNLTNNTETDYYYLNNQLVASNTHPTGQTGTVSDATYYADDIIGTPLLATTSNQSLKSQSTYYPYGNLYSQSPASSETNPSIGFAGKVHEANTGLSYSGARYYDPTLGRFISTDPVGFKSTNPMTFNRYDYADNNPYRYVDPTGDSSSLSWFDGLLNSIGMFDAGAIQYQVQGYEVAGEEAQRHPIVGSIIIGGLSFGIGDVAEGIGLGADVADGGVAADGVVANNIDRLPRSIQDQMTLKAAQEGQGNVIIKNLSDPKYQGMEKIQLKVKSANGNDSVVHYVRDPETGRLMDFKFKKYSTDQIKPWGNDPSVSPGG